MLCFFYSSSCLLAGPFSSFKVACSLTHTLVAWVYLDTHTLVVFIFNTSWYLFLTDTLCLFLHATLVAQIEAWVEAEAKLAQQSSYWSPPLTHCRGRWCSCTTHTLTQAAAGDVAVAHTPSLPCVLTHRIKFFFFHTQMKNLTFPFFLQMTTSGHWKCHKCWFFYGLLWP